MYEWTRGPACDRRHGKWGMDWSDIITLCNPCAQLCKSIIDKLFTESFRDAPPHVPRKLRKCAADGFCYRMGDGSVFFLMHTRFVTIARPKTIGAGPLWRRRQRPPYTRRKDVFGYFSARLKKKNCRTSIFIRFAFRLKIRLDASSTTTMKVSKSWLKKFVFFFFFSISPLKTQQTTKIINDQIDRIKRPGTLSGV